MTNEPVKEVSVLTTMRYDPMVTVLSLLLTGSHSALSAPIQNNIVFYDYHYKRLIDSITSLNYEIDLTPDLFLSIVNKAIDEIEDKSKCYKVRLLINKNGDIFTESILISPLFGKYFDGIESDSTSLYDIYIDSEHFKYFHNLSTISNFKTSERNNFNIARKRSLPGKNKNGFEEVLIYDSDNYVTEGSITNFAIKRGEKWITPKLRKTGPIKGVVRKFLLDGGIIEEGEVKLEECISGIEILLFNAVLGTKKGIIV